MMIHKKMSSLSTPSSESETSLMSSHDPKYACITCLHPTPILYRQYSTIYNIKLQQCSFCSRDVDKYIERELLLVCMDIILFRKHAYRHLLFNRSLMRRKSVEERSKMTKTTEEKNSNLFMDFICSWDDENWFNMIIGLFIIVSFRVILKVEGFQSVIASSEQSDTCHSNYYDQTSHSDTTTLSQAMDYIDNQSSLIQIGISFAITSMEYILLYFGTVFTTMFLIKQISRSNSPSSKQHYCNLSSTISREIYLAIFLPQLFNIVTLIVHIYEHSSTVRLLGSIFVFSFNYMAVNCVLERAIMTVSSPTVSIQNDKGEEGKQRVTNVNMERKKNVLDQVLLSFSKIIPAWPLFSGLMLSSLLSRLLVYIWYWRFKNVPFYLISYNTNDSVIGFVQHLIQVGC